MSDEKDIFVVVDDSYLKLNMLQLLFYYSKVNFINIVKY